MSSAYTVRFHAPGHGVAFSADAAALIEAVQLAAPPKPE